MHPVRAPRCEYDGKSMKTGTTTRSEFPNGGKAGFGYGKSYKHPKPTFTVASLNVGTLKKGSSEVVESLTRRRVDICSVQEPRWAGGIQANQTRLMKGKNSNYKFYWCGNRMGLGGVGFLLAEKWIEKVFDFQRVSDRILLLRLVIDKTVFAFISVYSPQVGRPDVEKEQFYDLLQEIVSKVPNSKFSFRLVIGTVMLVVLLVVLRHGGFGYGNRDIEGERLLEFAAANNLIVGNTQFKKRDSHLITHSFGENNSQIDYILYPKSFKKSAISVKVIPGEECALQHHLLVCGFKITTPKIKSVISVLDLEHGNFVTLTSLISSPLFLTQNLKLHKLIPHLTSKKFGQN